MNDGTTINAPTPIVRKILFEELVDKEARHIVLSMIEEELDKHNLPLPKETSLNTHIDYVLKARPDIIDKARQLVDARLDAHTKTLEQIGVKLEVIKPIEIDL